MSCIQNFCYNIGEQLQWIKELYEENCWNKECNNILLPKERDTLLDYIQCEYLDRRTMELGRCFIQNVLKSKKDKSVKQFSLVPHQQISGRVNPERNMLTQMKECEKIGVETVSQARFMGSVATTIRCDTSSFNLNTLKKILNDTSWRLRSHFNSVQQKAMTELMQVFHAYIVGTLVGNSIRTWTPNVVYTYGLYATQNPKTMKRDFCTLSEKVITVSKESNLRDMIMIGKLTPELFLSMLGQVALTLEMFQQRGGYCHNNLYPDHILLRPVFNQTGAGITWSYMLYGKEYKMKSLQFLATISDFTKSSFDPSTFSSGGSIDLESDCIASSVDGFLVPGKDMCVFIQTIRQVVLKTLDSSDSKNFLVDAYGQENNMCLLAFCDLVLQEIFMAPDYFFEKNVATGEGMVHNVMVCQGAGLTPLGFLESVEMMADKVKSVLKVSKLPWVIEDRQGYIPVICKKKIPLFLADLMPNWKAIVDEKSFFGPISPLTTQEISESLNKLLDMEKNKKIIQEFDFRPVMTIGDQPQSDNMDFYQKNIFQPDGYFHEGLKNTIDYYNLLLRFLDTYYYAYYIQDKDMMTEFSKNNDKITILMRSVHKPTYMSNLANIVRFLQMVSCYNKVLNKKNCCVATQQTLGNLAQQGILQQQTTQQQQKAKKQQKDIYKITQQQGKCGPKTPIDSYPLQQTVKQLKLPQEMSVSLQQQVVFQQEPPARTQQQTKKQQLTEGVVATTQQGMLPSTTQQQKSKQVGLIPQTQKVRQQQQLRFQQNVLPTNQQIVFQQNQLPPSTQKQQQRKQQVLTKSPLPPPPPNRMQQFSQPTQVKKVQQQVKKIQQQMRNLNLPPPPPPPTQGKKTQQQKKTFWDYIPF